MGLVAREPTLGTGLGLSPSPWFLRRAGPGSWVSYHGQWLNQSCLGNEASIKKELWGAVQRASVNMSRRMCGESGVQEALSPFPMLRPLHLSHLPVPESHPSITNWWSGKSSVSLGSVSRFSKVIEPKEGVMVPASLARRGISIWSGKWFCGAEPSTYGLWLHLQVASVRIELNRRVSSWCWRLWKGTTPPQKNLELSAELLVG